MKFEQFRGWMTVEFGEYYRQNRHRNKKTKVTLEVSVADEKLNWQLLCRLKKNEEVEWEFPEDCPQFLQRKVKGLVSDEDVKNAFQNMEYQKTF